MPKFEAKQGDFAKDSQRQAPPSLSIVLIFPFANVLSKRK